MFPLLLRSDSYFVFDADPEDICGQPVSHHAAEVVNICAMPGHERLPQ